MQTCLMVEKRVGPEYVHNVWFGFDLVCRNLETWQGFPFSSHTIALLSSSRRIPSQVSATRPSAIIIFILSVIDSGIAEQDASFLMSFVGVGTLFGKIITAFVLGRKLARLMYFYIISVLGWGVSIMLLRVPTSFAWFVVVALSVGIFSGANICMKPMVIRHVVGVDMIGRGFGVLMIFSGIGSIVGPIISSKIYYRKDIPVHVFE